MNFKTSIIYDFIFTAVLFDTFHKTIYGIYQIPTRIPFKDAEWHLTMRHGTNKAEGGAMAKQSEQEDRSKNMVK